ncbi:hypothetical protein SK128_023840 [Halocaridina rubra]|uniref:Uncharacterized protein n=1 Tax=Halocaridina rubra TaxID=373956 RepID=A0AAN9A7U1_HALRR
MSDRKAELERKKAKLMALREEKERRKREKEQKEMPTTENEWMDEAHNFECIWNFDHYVGGLDSKHITVQVPSNTGTDYYNYREDMDTDTTLPEAWRRELPPASSILPLHSCPNNSTVEAQDILTDITVVCTGNTIALS